MVLYIKGNNSAFGVALVIIVKGHNHLFKTIIYSHYNLAVEMISLSSSVQIHRGKTQLR